MFYKNVLVSHDVELCADEAHVRAGGGGNDGDNQPRNEVQVCGRRAAVVSVSRAGITLGRDPLANTTPATAAPDR